MQFLVCFSEHCPVRRLACASALIALIATISNQTRRDCDDSHAESMHICCAATTSGIQYNLPSCRNTVQQSDVCGSSNPIAGTCCPIGMSCSQSPRNSTFVCMESSNLSWDFAPPSCTQRLHPSDTCGSPLMTHALRHTCLGNALGT